MRNTEPAADRRYCHRLRRQVRTFRVDLARKQWCDFWHHHFDMRGLGNRSWRLRRLHLSALIQALGRVRHELETQERPYQLFAIIDIADAGGDGLFVHTPNPNGTPFPCDLEGRELRAVPRQLAGQVDLARYRVLMAASGRSFYVLPR
jgi:hypothetical protein